jgi:hypothetical protein
MWPTWSQGLGEAAKKKQERHQMEWERGARYSITWPTWSQGLGEAARKKQERHQMEWERGARRVKFGRDTSTHSVSIPCWSCKQITTIFNGTWSCDRIKIFCPKRIVLSLNKNAYWVLNLRDEPRMSCRLCHFLRGEGENKWDKLYFLEFAAKLLWGPPWLLFVNWINFDSYWSIVPAPTWSQAW